MNRTVELICNALQVSSVVKENASETNCVVVYLISGMVGTLIRLEISVLGFTQQTAAERRMLLTHGFSCMMGRYQSKHALNGAYNIQIAPWCILTTKKTPTNAKYTPPELIRQVSHTRQARLHEKFISQIPLEGIF